MCDRVGNFLFTKMTSSDEIQLEKKATSAWKTWLQDNMFLMYTLSGVFFGVTIDEKFPTVNATGFLAIPVVRIPPYQVLQGFILRPLNLSQDAILLISYPGEIFMRVLKLMILPFVISCLITGTATLNIGKNGRIAVRTFTYFVSTSAINVTLGMILVLIIHPGDPGVRQQTTPVLNVKKMNIIDGFLDMGRNLVPDNIFQAAFEQTFTEYVPVEPQPIEIGTSNTNINNSSVNQTSVTNPTPEPKMKRQLQFRTGTNTLGIIFFCMIFGSVLGTLGPQRHIIIDFFSVVYQVLLKMLMGAIWLTPLGVGSIICAKIITIVNLSQTLLQLSWFIFTVALGVFIYQFVILQLIYYMIVRKNPYNYYLTFGPSIITAFATASKAAALPLTFQIMDEKIKASERITRFVLPIGTLNMDGTALFITVATAFLAQINNIPLGVNEILTLGFSCLAASFSATAVPSAALVLVLMLCSTINAPPEDVSLLFAVDWFVDRIRTTNNLLGDVYACAVIEKLSKQDLEAVQRDEERAKARYQQTSMGSPQESRSESAIMIEHKNGLLTSSP